MLLAIQIPLADCRWFVDPGAILPKPAWPRPTLSRRRRQFVRAFGPVALRPKGGLWGWIGESVVCDARNAVKFENIPGYQSAHLPYQPARLAYRRFFSDGVALAKLEIGFSFARAAGTFPKDFQAALEAVLECPVNISIPNQSTYHDELRDCGSALAEKYLFSSTRFDSDIVSDTAKWWIAPGQPLAVIEHKANTEKPMPKWARHVREYQSNGLHVTHGYWPEDNLQSAVRVWTIGFGNRASAEKARQLRITLTRLHAEEQVLHIVLENLATHEEMVLDPAPEGSPASELLRYLNNARKRIRSTHKKLKETAGAEIFSMARDIEDRVRPGERAALLEKLEKIRRVNVRRSLKDYANAPRKAHERRSIFISYAREDKQFLILLDKHLKPYTRLFEIDVWHDRQIDIGDDWSEEIKQAMERADLAVFLVTPSLLASDFIMNVELPRLHERAKANELVLAWLPISASAHHTTSLNDYQAAWDPGVPLDTLDEPRQNVELANACKRLFTQE